MLLYHNCKDNQIRSPSFLSGPKGQGGGVYEVTLFDLKPQSRLYEFLVQIKVMDLLFSIDC